MDIVKIRKKPVENGIITQQRQKRILRWEAEIRELHLVTWDAGS
jgi:hypothetical protein